MSLTVNGLSGLVTLNDTVTLLLSCVARGVPTPTLSLWRVSRHEICPLKIYIHAFCLFVYISLICMCICALNVFYNEVVNRFESLKALYKIPFVIIITNSFKQYTSNILEGPSNGTTSITCTNNNDEYDGDDEYDNDDLYAPLLYEWKVLTFKIRVRYMKTTSLSLSVSVSVCLSVCLSVSVSVSVSLSLSLSHTHTHTHTHIHQLCASVFSVKA